MKKILFTLISILSIFFTISAQAQETAHSDLFPATERTTSIETTEETNHDLPPLPPPPKENISATFTTSPQVNYGSYQWTIELTTDNSDEMMLDTSKVQIWSAFRITDYTKFGSKLIITLEPKQPPLQVECNTYTLTIPKKALTTLFAENEKNITGNFQVLNCPEKTQSEESEENSEITSTGSTETQLNPNSQYLPILAQKDGFLYIDIKGLSLGFFYILLSFSLFYVLFRFFYKKN